MLRTVVRTVDCLQKLRPIVLTEVVNCGRTVTRIIHTNVRSSQKLRILFFGTDDYSLEHLKFFDCSRNSSLVSDLQVVVPNLQCPVGKYAKSRNIYRHVWPANDSLADYDVGIVVSFGHLIPKRIINRCSNGIINVHPSLLPRWRGAAPIPHSILAGDTVTGVTIIHIAPDRFDVGPILAQAQVAMPELCTSNRLAEYLAPIGARLLIKVLSNLTESLKNKQPQSNVGIIHAPKFTSDSTLVNWQCHTADEVERQYRALGELHGLRSEWQHHKVRLMDIVPRVEMQEKWFAAELAKMVERRRLLSPNADLPGAALYLWHKHVICVRCKDDWVAFRRVIIKRPMRAQDFYNGYMSLPEERFTLFKSHENGLDKFLHPRSYACTDAVMSQRHR